jgi:MtfA peptidase
MTPLEIILLVVLIVLFVVRFKRGIAEPFNAYYYNRVKYSTPISRKEYRLVNDTLGNRFTYYNVLSDDGKARFVNRCVHVLRAMKFVGKEELEVSLEMKVTVAAAFAQVGYRLEKYVPDYLHTILIYPKPFYIEQIDKVLKGGVTPNGFMAISWYDLDQGFQLPHDGYNLGLHEVAHAFKLSAQHQQTEKDFFSFYIERWLQITDYEYQRIRNGLPSALREYAGTNPHEFFAVCIEHFFEVPQSFHKELPDIFNHLCILLNQNPLNTTGDYILTEAYIKSVNSDPQRIKMPIVKVKE